MNEESKARKEKHLSSNEELEKANLELIHTNSDLANLLEIIDIPIIVVGSDLKIRYLTPAATKLLHPASTDTGRFVRDLTDNINTLNLDQLILNVIRDESIREQNVQDRKGHWYSMYIKPYRGFNNRVDGAVILFLDIDNYLKTETRLRYEMNKLINIFNTIEDGIYIANQQYEIEYINPVLKKEFGIPEGRKCFEYFYSRKAVCPWCKNREALGGKSVRWEWYSPNSNKIYEIIDAALKNPDGSVSQLKIFRDVTERKKAEEKLLKNEKKYRQLIESMHEGIWVVDKSAHTTLINPRMAQILGYTMDEIEGNDSFSYFDKSNQQIWKNSLERSKQGLKEKQDLTLINSDGKKIYISIVMSGISDDSGNYIGTVTHVMDITERKKVEDALRDSEERYRTTLNSMGDAIHVIDKDLRFILFNETFKEWNKQLGITTDVIGKTIFEVFRFLSDKIRAEYSEVFDTGKVLITEEHNKIGEREFITEIRKIPIFEEGKVHRIVTVVRDITERKRTEKTLRDSESKFRALSENSPNMIFINKGGRIVYANKRCEEVTGYKKEEFYSDEFNFLILIAPESREVINRAFKRHMEGEDVLPYEYTIITKKGKRIETIVTTKLIDYGGQKAILGIVTDITKLKKAEEVLKRDRESFERLVDEKTKELLKTQKKLVDAKRLSDIGALAATVAHELRNPLAVIRAAIYNINRKRENPLLDKHIAHIEKSVLEGNQIINNLLFYSRIRVPNYESIDIFNILNDSITSAQDRYKKKSVLIVNKFKCLKNLLIEADPLQIKELFTNILNNSFDAIIDKGSVEIGAKCEENDIIKVYFNDRGGGISKEDLKRIYEPFFSTKSKGTGLGLAVCRQIVALHDGKIEIESEKDKGTTVTITLPVKRKTE